MLNVTKELTALARKLGYEGKTPDTVAKAINAITASVGSGSGCDCKIMVVHMETDPETEVHTIVDATAGEIYEAMQDGKICLCQAFEEEEMHDPDNGTVAVISVEPMSVQMMYAPEQPSIGYLFTVDGQNNTYSLNAPTLNDHPSDSNPFPDPEAA